jgi:hypothetical protein
VVITAVVVFGLFFRLPTTAVSMNYSRSCHELDLPVVSLTAT